MFDPDLVRYLCEKLASEEDPHRFEEIATTLHAVLLSDTEETRLRMSYLMRHYPEVVEDTPELPTGKAA
jgi:hypothetical protein